VRDRGTGFKLERSNIVLLAFVYV